ncbi:hypothetical protein OESDEN_00068 [Oesophagostomum dentatum]|uniref:Uncharacterized protein n=1 Tax=Oesophagostomum dentatum TaxID=61180 RepID=A0A0B1TQP9_OESDE|nr:hypothetical protein OESDEN_00068 [Oesophagostomum dentatum]
MIAVSLSGSEFEISVVPQKSAEDDLFADLAPKLPTPPSLEDQLRALQMPTNIVQYAFVTHLSQDHVSLQDHPVSNVPSKFAMVETVDDAVCWDENEDLSLGSTGDSASTKATSKSLIDEDNQ